MTRVSDALGNWRVRVGLALVVFTVAVAILGPIVSPYSPTQIISAPYEAPSREFLLGTDKLGRDILARLLHGGTSLVWMSCAAMSFGVALGAILGLTGAFHGGRVDSFIMRAVDVKLAFPSTIFALLAVTALGPGKLLLVFLVGLSQAPSVARVLRGAALTIVSTEYVQYARAIGIPNREIIRTDVLPNVATPLLVEAGLRLMWAISALAGLSFLGHGIQPPSADWGLMINENRNALSVQPWAVLAPICAIAIFTVGGNLIAEGVSRAVGRTEGAS